MSSPSDSLVQAQEPFIARPPEAGDRRSDVDAKQARIGALLKEIECDLVFLLEPENYAWLTSGAVPRSVLDPEQLPGLMLNVENRHVLASNVDAQRIFDEDIDGLGFQLKEWNWSTGRAPLLTYLGRNRRLASDVPRPDCKPVGEQIRLLRRALTAYELTVYQELGRILSHALEATCRALTPGQSEQETAGHLSHRLLKRGAEVAAIEVTADERLRRYRRAAFTAAPITRQCVLTATARLAGLNATASRSVYFGQLDPAFQREHDAACKVSAGYIGASAPGAVPATILSSARRIYQINQFEHEWRHFPPGCITGRAPVEQLLTGQSTEPLQAGWAITWRASVGAASSCDTFVVTSKGPQSITVMPGNWPKKRIRIQGTDFDRPDLFTRDAKASV